MKRLLVLLIGCGVFAFYAFSPHAAAAPDPNQAWFYNIRPGDNVRLCLDRARSGQTAWLGGVVINVDSSSVTISATIHDPVTPGDGSVVVRRRVEQWVPMTSILYIEKMLDGRADETP